MIIMLMTMMMINDNDIDDDNDDGIYNDDGTRLINSSNAIGAKQELLRTV